MTAIAKDLQVSVGAYRKGLLLVALAGVCWSSMGLFIRLMEVATPWQILFTRSTAFVVLLLVVLALRHEGRPLRAIRKAGLPGVIGGLGLLFAFSGGVYAIVHTTVANAMFLFASAPFMVALLSGIVLGESVRRATWIATLVAALGVGLMVWEGISAGRLAGNLSALLSAGGFAVFTLALRRGRSGDMTPAVCLGGVFTALATGAFCLMTGQALLLPAHDLALAACMGWLQIGLGLLLYTLGSKWVPAAELALLSMTEVVLGPFWVWLLLGETAGLWTLLGGIVVLAAIGGNALSGLRRRPPPIGAV